jgi:GNAT superfamily N-acetyltransferase
VTGPATIVRAHPGDADAVAELIAAAFAPLAVARWLVAEDEIRARIFPGYFRILVDHALTYGVIDRTLDRHAAALWLPSGAPVPAEYEERLAGVCGSHLSRFIELDAVFAENHPVAAPHHHLAILAVRPGYQAAGRGSALLAHHHHELDIAGVPAYLEATSGGARELYRRHGYQDMPGAPVSLPHGGPPLWPMLRPARAADRWGAVPVVSRVQGAGFGVRSEVDGWRS